MLFLIIFPKEMQYFQRKCNISKGNAIFPKEMQYFQRKCNVSKGNAIFPKEMT